MKVLLKVVAGQNEGLTFEFDRHDTFIVGRGSRSHFRIVGDEYFSRNHFLIEINPPLCCLLDLSSRNGTHVNNEQVGRATLKSGDIVRAGRTRMEVVVEGAPAPAEIPDEALPPLIPLPPLPSEGAPAGSPASDSIPFASTFVPTPPLSGEVTLVPHGKRRQSQPGTDSPTPIPIVPSRKPGSRTPPPVESFAATVAPLDQSLPVSPPVAPPAVAQFQDTTSLPTLPGFEIIRLIGQGGMGKIYEARTIPQRQHVAVKVILPAVDAGEDEVNRFIREAQILKSMVHEHIVRFLDLKLSSGQLCIVMDYINGSDLGQLMKTATSPLSIPQGIRWTLQLLKALAYAHDQGFVHRDVKPANMLIGTLPDGKQHLYLADFGLARVYQASKLSGLTVTGEMGGTVAFMPPEQITSYRNVSPAADQYAAAANLYYMLTKSHIYDLPRETPRQLLMILQDTPIPITARRPDIPPLLAKVIHKALSRNPEDRFPSVVAFGQALLKCR